MTAKNRPILEWETEAISPPFPATVFGQNPSFPILSHKSKPLIFLLHSLASRLSHFVPHPLTLVFPTFPQPLRLGKWDRVKTGLWYRLYKALTPSIRSPNACAIRVRRVNEAAPIGVFAVPYPHG